MSSLDVKAYIPLMAESVKSCKYDSDCPGTSICFSKFTMLKKVFQAKGYSNGFCSCDALKSVAGATCGEITSRGYVVIVVEVLIALLCLVTLCRAYFSFSNLQMSWEKVVNFTVWDMFLMKEGRVRPAKRASALNSSIGSGGTPPMKLMNDNDDYGTSSNINETAKREYKSSAVGDQEDGGRMISKISKETMGQVQSKPRFIHTPIFISHVVMLIGLLLELVRSVSSLANQLDPLTITNGTLSGLANAKMHPIFGVSYILGFVDQFMFFANVGILVLIYLTTADIISRGTILVNKLGVSSRAVYLKKAKYWSKIFIFVYSLLLVISLITGVYEIELVLSILSSVYFGGYLMWLKSSIAVALLDFVQKSAFGKSIVRSLTNTMEKSSFCFVVSFAGSILSIAAISTYGIRYYASPFDVFEYGVIGGLLQGLARAIYYYLNQHFLSNLVVYGVKSSNAYEFEKKSASAIDPNISVEGLGRGLRVSSLKDRLTSHLPSVSSENSSPELGIIKTPELGLVKTPVLGTGSSPKLSILTDGNMIDFGKVEDTAINISPLIGGRKSNRSPSPSTHGPESIKQKISGGGMNGFATGTSASSPLQTKTSGLILTATMTSINELPSPNRLSSPDNSHRRKSRNPLKSTLDELSDPMNGVKE